MPLLVCVLGWTGVGAEWDQEGEIVGGRQSCSTPIWIYIGLLGHSSPSNGLKRN